MRAFAATLALCFVVGSVSAGFLEQGAGRDGPAIIAHGGSNGGHSHGPIAVAAPHPIAHGPHLESSGGHDSAAVGAAIVAAGPSKPRLHEIHTHSAKSIIRVEEYARPNQVIRVHEAPQAPPEIIKVRGPAEPQSLIRVVAKSSGPAHIERVVHRPRGVQVINVQKPSGPPARIVHVVREAAPAPKVEFINEPERQSHIYVAQSPAGSEVVLAPAPGASNSGGSTLQDRGFADAILAQGGPALSSHGPALAHRGPVISEALPAPFPAVSGPAFPAHIKSFAVAAPAAEFHSAPVHAHHQHADIGYNGHSDVSVKTKVFRKYHHHH